MQVKQIILHYTHLHKRKQMPSWIVVSGKEDMLMELQAMWDQIQHVFLQVSLFLYQGRKFYKTHWNL